MTWAGLGVAVFVGGLLGWIAACIAKDARNAVICDACSMERARQCRQCREQIS